MKKSVNVLVSIFCVCAMLISLSAPTIAASIYSSSNIGVDVNDSQLIQMMEDMGFTDGEISYIMELEYERRENPFPKSLSRGFPKNPYIGQKYTATYRVHFSTITMTVSGIAGALIKGGVGAGIAVVLASAILNEWQENLDAKGVEVSIQYVYGETNDGVLGWNMGRQSWSLFY